MHRNKKAVLFLLFLLFFKFYSAAALPGGTGGTIEGSWNSPEELRFRIRLKTLNLLTGGALTFNEEGYSGGNFHLSLPWFSAGSLNPRGLLTDLLSPGITRASETLYKQHPELVTDTSFTGSTLKGAVLHVPGGAAGLFAAVRGESDTLLGGWGAVSPGRFGFSGGLLFSFPEKKPGSDDWILENPRLDSPFLVTGAVRGTLTGDRGGLGLFAGGGGGSRDLPGGWGRAVLVWKPDVLNLAIQTGFSSPLAWKPDGSLIGENFNWKVQTQWFPRHLFGFMVSLGETQDHLSLYPGPYREFDSFLKGGLYFRPGRCIFSVHADRSLGGDSAGLISERRNYQSRIAREGRTSLISLTGSIREDSQEGRHQVLEFYGRLTGNSLGGNLNVRITRRDEDLYKKLTGEVQFRARDLLFTFQWGLNREEESPLPLLSGNWDFRAAVKLDF